MPVKEVGLLILLMWLCATISRLPAFVEQAELQHLQQLEAAFQSDDPEEVRKALERRKGRWCF